MGYRIIKVNLEIYLLLNPVLSQMYVSANIEAEVALSRL